MLFCISAHLAIWIYPDVRKAGYSKQESATITSSYVATIINDLTMDEWINIIQKSDTNAEVDYFYVRDHIKKPTITKNEIKAKLQQFLFDIGLDGTVDDVEEAFETHYGENIPTDIEISEVLSNFNKSGWGRYEESLYNKIIEYLDGYLWDEVTKTNPEFANDDKYSDGLTDFGSEITCEMILDIMDGETIITVEEWKEMLIAAAQKGERK